MGRYITAGFAAALMVVAVAGSAGASAPAANAHQSQLRVMTAHRATGHASGAAPSVRKVEHPFLVPDPAAYARAKRLADARAASLLGRGAPRVTSGTAGHPMAPVIAAGWLGLKDANTTPSDSTGAVGTQRYIELVNSQAAIYTRSHALVGAQMTIQTLVGSGPTDAVFDPQVIWDGQQNRFFYAADWIVSASDNRIAFGWSKTATPSSAADFCRYGTSFGASFPDYPKLGDSKDFLLIGVNQYTGLTYTTSNVLAINKPALGATCPSAGSLVLNLSAALMDDLNTTRTFTPVPAQQTDTAARGWVVTRVLDVFGSTTLYLYSVTKSGSLPVFQVVGTPITVPAYDYPSSASQPSPGPTIDTADTRLTQAVSAIDPRFGRVAIWTQHTVAAGLTSAVRWYEIDPTNALLFQTGKVTLAGAWVFDGAISSDRQVNGSVKHFGSNMVITYDTVSTTQFPTIRVRSKLGVGAISAPTLVKAATSYDADFACVGVNAGIPCRWGDYAAATPDPVLASAGATRGRVWITNQYNAPAVDPVNFAYWRTWNASVTP